jgi:hypothetical protein
MLEVRETDHARAAVARSLIVGWLELLDAEDAFTARSRMRCSRATHAAKAYDNHIEAGHRVGF